MKLSELTTERAFDVLCEITPFVTSITSDDALLKSLSNKIGKEGLSVAEMVVFGASKIAEIAPILLKSHKADVLGILAVLNETTVEAVSAQKIIKTMEQIRDAVNDKELLDFFKSLRQKNETE